MPLNVCDKGGSDFEQVPQGTHVAICNMVIDLGMQETLYGNKHQLYIRWELPGERITWTKDGKTAEGPMSIGCFYTASLSSKANLRHDLEGWRGRAFTAEELEGFDVFKVLGTCCQITVTHNDKGKARVKSVVSFPKGMTKPSAENPLVKYSLDEPGQFAELPDWLKEIVSKQIDEPSAKDQPVKDFKPDDVDDIPW